MRRELERYRLELSNREGNFNRMFTTSNPVRVDSRLKGLSLGMTRQKSVNVGSSASNLVRFILIFSDTERPSFLTYVQGKEILQEISCNDGTSCWV